MSGVNLRTGCCVTTQCWSASRDSHIPYSGMEVGKVRHEFKFCECPAQAGDIILLGDIPAGVVVHSSAVQVISPSDASVAFLLGDDDGADTFGGGNVDTAGIFLNETSVGYTEDNQFKIKMLGDADKGVLRVTFTLIDQL